MRASLLPALASSIALRWLADGQPVGHQRVHGSLLVADISGYTRLSERLARHGRGGAEEVVRLVDLVMTALVAEIEARGGDVLVFAGDALVVLFDGPDAPTRGALTAAAIRRWVAACDAVATSVGRVVLRVSISVATGPVDLVLAGGEEMGLFVAGPTASELVRLERAAGAGEAIVSEATAAAVPPAWLGEHRDGGRLLSRAVPVVPAVSSGVPPHAVNDPRLVPTPCRALLDVGPMGLEGDHRLATLAFLLASGLDHRLADAPESVAADLDELYRTVGAAASRHGVTVLGPDTAPDGVALFLAAGAPTAAERTEERMLWTLRDVLGSPVAGRLHLRAGVNRGPVFAGIVGAPHRGVYTAMGDATNLAARVAAQATPGELLATADVVLRSEVEFETEPAPSFTPKGKRAEVVPYRVGAPQGRHARTPARLPLAGRDDELRLLEAQLADAAAGRGSIVVITGEPGVGKSRLVSELLARHGVTARVEVRFNAGDETTPYYGLRPALRDLAGISDDGTDADAAERLRSWARSLVPSVAPSLPLVGVPFGVAIPETPEVAGLAPAFRRERMHEAVTSLLRAALGPGTVLLLEDLHWSDEASFALLETVARGAREHGWLVLALARSSAPPFAIADVIHIELSGLDAAAVARLAIDSAGETPLSDAEIGVIVERAAGIPLFVRELAALAAEHGGLEALPDRLETLLASRIDRLDGRHRALLRRAAVLGRTIELDLLARVLPDEPLVRDLAAWSALDEFVGWVDQNRLRFRHDLFREAAYEGLAVETRQTLHRRLAEALMESPGADPDELAALLANHFARAGDLRHAFEYSRRGGDVARRRYANVDAAALYRRALEAGTAVRSVGPAELATVAEALGDVAELAGEYEGSIGAYASARRLTRARGSESAGGEPAGAVAARIARKTGIVRERAGRYRDALAWYARASRLLPDVGGREAEALRIRLDLDRAGIRFRQGRYGACVAVALPASKNAERLGDRALLAQAYYLLNAGYSELGSPEAARYSPLSLPIYVELGDLVGQGNALNNLGVDAYFEGRWDDALDLYAQSKRAKMRAGDIANAATQSNNEAEILSDQGRYEEAEALLRDALRVWGAAGYEIGIALATSNLGRAAARAGRHDEGVSILEDAVRRFERIGAAGYVDETRARVAEALALMGRAEDAAEAALATLARVRHETETNVLEAQLERTLGWCEILRGDPDAMAEGRLDASLQVGRALNARFEVALTLRARRALPALAPDELEAAAREAAEILARLGVVSVPEPPVATLP